MLQVKNLFRHGWAGGHCTWVYTGQVPSGSLEALFEDLFRATDAKSGDLLILPSISTIRFIHYILETKQSVAKLRLHLVKPK